jgi:hypothetical protein
MTTPRRKRIKVQYRKLSDLTGGFGGKSLEDALRAAMQHTGSAGILGLVPGARVCDVLLEYGTMVMSWFDGSKVGFLGEIVRYEPGSPVPLVNTATSGPAFNLTQAKPPQDHEAMRGVLYMLVIGDHAMIIEQDMNTARLELYLTWLLAQATQIIQPNAHVVLAAELSVASGASIQLSEVEQVTFKPKPVTQETLKHRQTEGGKASTRRGVAEHNTLEVLKAAGMDETDIQALANSDTQIQVTLQIKFKGDWRKKPVGMDDANRLLRNLPEDQFTLSGPGGTQRLNHIVKLTHPANIEVDGAHLNPVDVARALYEAYEVFKNNGYLD